MAKTFGSSAAELMEAQTKANMKVFSDAMAMFNPFAAAIPGAAEVKAEEPASDLDALKRQMSDMQERLDKLAKKR
jgi:polyhydroxyalkanoate synthesis regulator protein